MGQISKFLKKGEVIKYSFRSEHSVLKQIILFMLLLGAFFILYPIFQSGRQAFFLWLVIVIILAYLLILSYRTRIYYFITDRRLVAFFSHGPGKVRLAWQIALDAIISVSRSAKNEIDIIGAGKKYTLRNMRQTEKIFNHLKYYSENR